jgi:hypothetical protein
MENCDIDCHQFNGTIRVFHLKHCLLSDRVNFFDCHGMVANLNEFATLEIDLMISHLPAPLTKKEIREKTSPALNTHEKIWCAFASLERNGHNKTQVLLCRQRSL